MTTRILIMGLPGSGKTTLAKALQAELWEAGRTVTWLNADQVRTKYNDWDFSTEGRIRQSTRMRMLADNATTDYVICDFVCPLPEMRDNFDAHITVWLDTIPAGRFEDTNQAFITPKLYDYRVTDQDTERWAKIIAANILP
jgi:adenylylsulfate kinase